MNPFIINCLHLANDSYCKHLISDIFQYSVAQVSHVPRNFPSHVLRC